MNLSILVLSCDKYSDLWLPFFKLKNKYFVSNYDTFIATETKKCDYCQTINVNESVWTKRIRESLKQIKTKYVLIMCDDFFIREYVDTKRIEETLKMFDDKTATFNFELSYNDDDIKTNLKNWKLRPNKSKYMLSCQAGIWEREVLINLLGIDCDAWEWERIFVDSKYKFYINSGDYIINYGYKDYIWFGIRKGKWCREIVSFFEKENIKINYEERGFSD